VPTDAVPPSICVVTGSDYRQFGQLFLLMGSLQRYCPGLKLHVCDFGLTEPQRRFLRRKGVLLEMPAGMAGRSHPWHYKAALGRYVAGLGWDAVVWLDADLIVLTDIGPLLAELYLGMRERGHILAVAGTGATIGQQLTIEKAPHFADLVVRFNLDRGAIYLNSGFFMCRSAEFLQQWSALCDTMAIEILFEQNAFNLVALTKPGGVQVVDLLRWNLCGNHLGMARVEASREGAVVMGPQGPAHILHATSSHAARDLHMADVNVTVDGTAFIARLRMISHPAGLRDFQQVLVAEAIATGARLLIESGLNLSG